MRNVIVSGDPPSVLRKARDLLNPKTWTQGALAIDEHGRMVAPVAKNVVAWSAEGAIRRFSGDSIGIAILAVIAVEVTLNGLEPELGQIRLETWNDMPGRTVDEVRQVMLASIKRLAARDALLRGKKVF